MKYYERCKIIQSLLNEKESYSVDELINNIGASAATIRRDIKKMETDNLLTRYHGGIKRNEISIPIPISVRNNISSNEKYKIGVYAANLLKNNQIVFIDSSSTGLSIINNINEKLEGLTIITNGLVQAQLCKKKNINCFLVGGFLYHHENSILGSETIKMINKYHYDISFIGALAIDNTRGLLAADELELELKEAVSKNSTQTYIVADVSKFNKKSLFKVDVSKKNTAIITTGKIENFDYFKLICIE